VLRQFLWVECAYGGLEPLKYAADVYERLRDLELRGANNPIGVMGDTCLDNLQPLSYSWFNFVSPWNSDQPYSLSQYTNFVGQNPLANMYTS
jgi:hypothetical protein